MKYNQELHAPQVGAYAGHQDSRVQYLMYAVVWHVSTSKPTNECQESQKEARWLSRKQVWTHTHCEKIRKASDHKYITTCEGKNYLVT